MTFFRPNGPFPDGLCPKTARGDPIRGSESSSRPGDDHRPLLQSAGFTELCVQALFRHTRPAWELIVIDNGSTDETAAYLAGVRDAASVPVTIIKQSSEPGVSPQRSTRACRQASGEYLVLLNNDAVVTDGWLDQLIALTAARVESEDRARPPHRRAGGEPSGTRRPAPSEDRPRRADVELRDSAAMGRECAVSGPGRDARVRPAMA